MPRAAVMSCPSSPRRCRARPGRWAAADLPGAARKVRQPVLLLLGAASPPWAGQITAELAAALPAATVSELPGAGHEALEKHQTR